MTATATTFADLVGTIMNTPIDAVTRGERAYLQIWKQRLTAIRDRAPSGSGTNTNMDWLRAELAYVPVMKLAGDINVAATVRLASVREIGGNIGLTVGVGPIGITGGFGYSQRSTEESVIQIAATFKLTNGEITLLDYLKQTQNITLAQPSDLTTAITHLDKTIKSIEPSDRDDN